MSRLSLKTAYVKAVSGNTTSHETSNKETFKFLFLFLLEFPSFVWDGNSKPVPTKASSCSTGGDGGRGQQALRFPLSIFTKTHTIPLKGALFRELQEAQGQGLPSLLL